MHCLGLQPGAIRAVWRGQAELHHALSGQLGIPIALVVQQRLVKLCRRCRVDRPREQGLRVCIADVRARKPGEPVGIPVHGPAVDLARWFIVWARACNLLEPDQDVLLGVANLVLLRIALLLLHSHLRDSPVSAWLLHCCVVECAVRQHRCVEDHCWQRRTNQTVTGVRTVVRLCGLSGRLVVKIDPIACPRGPALPVAVAAVVVSRSIDSRGPRSYERSHCTVGIAPRTPGATRQANRRHCRLDRSPGDSLLLAEQLGAQDISSGIGHHGFREAEVVVAVIGGVGPIRLVALLKPHRLTCLRDQGKCTTWLLQVFASGPDSPVDGERINLIHATRTARCFNLLSEAGCGRIFPVYVHVLQLSGWQLRSSRHYSVFWIEQCCTQRCGRCRTKCCHDLRQTALDQ